MFVGSPGVPLVVVHIHVVVVGRFFRVDEFVGMLPEDVSGRIDVC